MDRPQEEPPPIIVKKKRLYKEQSENAEDVEELETKQRKISESVLISAKELGRLKIFDRDYFLKAAEFIQQEQNVNDLDCRIFQKKFEGPEIWHDSEEGRRLTGKEQTLKAAFKHAQYLIDTYTKPKAQDLNFAALSFFNNFLRTCLCLKPSELGSGERAQGDQKAFKRSLIEANDAQHNTDPGKLWDCVQSAWNSREGMKAAHLFEWRSTKLNLEQIFGEDCKDELFSNKNGLLLPEAIETAFDNFCLVFVPNIDNLEDKEQLLSWESRYPREYKIKILEPERKELKRKLIYLTGENGKPLQIKDLDNRPLQFRTSHRPRARYIYWRYILAMFHGILSTAKSDGEFKMKKFYDHTLKYAWPTLRGRHILNAHFRVFHEVLGQRLPISQPAPNETSDVELPSSVPLEICSDHLGSFNKQPSREYTRSLEKFLAHNEKIEDEEAHIDRVKSLEIQDSDGELEGEWDCLDE